MNKLLKILLAVVGVVVVVIVALAIFLPLFFDPNDYKGQIESAVKAQTGRDLTLTGDLSLSVFPWLGVELGKASLSNAPGFGEQPFAAVNSASVRLKIMPLLEGNIEVGRVILDGLNLHLAKNAQGQNNWQDMLEHNKEAAGTKEPAGKPAKPEAQKESYFKVKSLQVAGVDVTDANISWDDAQTGKHYVLKDVSLTTGSLSKGKSVPLELSLHAAQGKSMSAQIQLKGSVTADTDKQQYKVEDLVADITATLASVPNGEQRIHLSVPQLSADLASEQYSLPSLTLEARLAGDSIPGGKQTIKLTSDKLQVDLKAQTLQMPSVKLTGLGGTINASLSGQQIEDAMRLNGHISAANLKPRDIMQTLGMDIPSGATDAALQSASLDAQIHATADRADLTSLKAQLDSTHLSGSASLSNFSNPAIGFSLNADQLNVDHYLGAHEKAAKPSKVKVTAAPAAEGKVQSKESSTDFKQTEIPVDPIRGLNMDGKVAVGTLIFKGIRMTDTTLVVSAHNGRLEIKPLGSSLYNGTLKVSGGVDAHNDVPSYSLNSSLDALNFGSLMTDYYGDDKLSGLATIGLALSTRGKTVGAMLQSLDGKIDLSLKNGAIKGFNLAQMLRVAKAKFSGKPINDSEPQKTDFSVMAVTASIMNGVLTTPVVNGMSPFLRLGGNGSIDLASQHIDYTALLSVVKSMVGQGGKGLEDLAGLTIPLKLTGDLFSPHYKIDLGGMLKAKAQAEIDKKKQEVQQKVEKKLESRKQELFNSLLGGSKKAAPAAAGAAAAGSGAGGTSTAPKSAPAVQPKAATPAQEPAPAKEPAPAPAKEPNTEPAPTKEPAKKSDKEKAKELLKQIF